MKILVITDLYPVKDSEKYTPKTIFEFVKGWEKLGNEVRVIKPNFILNSYLRKKTFYKDGIYGNIENVNYWTPFLGNIKNKLKTNVQSFDIIIAHMPSGIIFANKLKKPFIAGVHTSDLEVLCNPLYSIYFKKEMENAYKNATKIACRSIVLKEKFLKLYPQYKEKTFVAYSGIDSKIITKRLWQNKTKYNVLTCANLIKRKNVDKIIKACDNLTNVNLTVIGDGKEYNRLKNLSSKTRFTGHLSNDEVLNYMRNSDIFILPSKNETFGMVYLEAMASGCVTVCLKYDGIDGIIQDGINGYLVETNNMQETIEKICSYDNTDLLENSYQTIQQYTKEKACLNYLRNITE